MREIIFRGKRVDNGEWVEGYLFNYNGNLCIQLEGIECDDYGLYPRCYAEVIPETIGQYTGLRDCKRTEEYPEGQMIFEGDIGRYEQTDGVKINGKPIISIGKVVYNEKTASFAIDSKDEIGVKNYDYFPIKGFEIIGNIHDNPELLKGGEEE